MEQRAKGVFRRYRVPEEDGEVLVEPGWEAVAGLVEMNRARQAEAAHYDCQGRRLGQLLEEARESLVQEAIEWTKQYHPQPSFLSETLASEAACRRDSRGATMRRSIFLAGHQPQLFHPGIWLKNFSLDHLARKHQAIGINLIVDHDVPHSMQIRTPSGTAEQPRWVDIPLDAHAGELPYEERGIVDWPTLESFGTRALEALQGLVLEPMVREFWPVVLERAKATGRLGAALAQARHSWEIGWGSQTLEVPFSRVCQGKAFLWFVAYVLGQLGQLHKHYNTILKEYRQAHRIRNPAQPVPDLRTQDGWWEAPLWIWSQQDPRRRAVYVHPLGKEWVVSNRAGLELRVPIGPEVDLTRAVDILAEWVDTGVRIRPKAILTTLWARLVLGEVFIHGIGGARYDQITDELIRRWMALEPPGFLVASGTLYLPVERPRGIREQWMDIRRALRELRWHPECFFDLTGCRVQKSEPVGFWWGQGGTEGGGPPEETDCLAKARREGAFGVSDAQGRPPESSKALVPASEEAAKLIAEKWRWIRTSVTPENARARFLAIRRINHALQAWLGEVRERLLAQKAALEAQLEGEKILRWRDCPFCFYPEKLLREFFFKATRDPK